MEELINLSHGSGGKSFNDLLTKIILPKLNNPYLNKTTDGAILENVEGRLVMACDGHVVTPRIFPGGSLGKLSFCGTVNDLAVMGARPLYLTMGLIIEEGLEIKELDFHIEEIAKLSKKWDIPIVSGDTKVVPRNSADGLFITMSGVGTIENSIRSPSPSNICPGDAIIINGAIGNHGISILSQRENLNFSVPLSSDCAPLHHIILKTWDKHPQIKCMRDPTRGGVAAVLNELALEASVNMEIDEDQLPIDKSVASACELMGLDPLLLANEGKFLLFCPQEIAEDVLATMKEHELGREAKIIGRVQQSESPIVKLKTTLGGSRLVPWHNFDQMPRIC
jgi:hydrogenase expression/formation protein HypE